MKPHYSDPSVTLFHSDCLDVLRGMPDSSVDAVVTDPPYGLEFMGKDWDAPWLETDINVDAGMSKTGYTDGGTRLDRPTFTGSTNPKCLTCKGTRRGRRDGTAKVAVCLCVDGGRFPNVRAVEMRAFQEWCEQWAAQCLRVLRPGGHLLAFGGSRTSHRLASGIEDAGFEIRDGIAWVYGTGFPKSRDVPRDIDKLGGEGTTWHGWGTALKPAQEPIVVARKPLVGTVAGNVLRYGTGALNIDATRVGTSGGGTVCSNRDAAGKCRGHDNAGRSTSGATVHGADSDPAGRWPANVVLSHTEWCVEVGTRQVRTGTAVNRNRTPDNDRATYAAYSMGNKRGGDVSYGTDGAETVVAWDCPEGCPVRELDAQSGVLHSQDPATRKSQSTVQGVTGFTTQPGTINYADTGGASRFFKIFRSLPSDVVFLPIDSETCQRGEEFTKVESTSAGRTPASNDANLPTDGSGNSRTDPSLTGTRSITETTMHLTTDSRISCASQADGMTTTTRDFANSTDGLKEPKSVDVSDATTTSQSHNLPFVAQELSTGIADPALLSTDGSGSHVTGISSTLGVENDMPEDLVADFPTFRYEAKAPTSERPGYVDDDGVRQAHSTVKPLDLMRWLVRLVTPPGGTVLDLFAGSGTTGEACVVEGFKCVLIEREAAYLPLIVARLSKPIQPDLFGGAG